MARAQMSKGLRTLSDQLDHETCSDLEEAEAMVPELFGVDRPDAPLS